MLQGVPAFTPNTVLVLFDDSANTTALPGLTLTRCVNLTIEFPTNITGSRQIVGASQNCIEGTCRSSTCHALDCRSERAACVPPQHAGLHACSACSMPAAHACMQGCGRSLLASEPPTLPAKPNSGLFVYNINDGTELHKKVAQTAALPGGWGVPLQYHCCPAAHIVAANHRVHFSVRPTFSCSAPTCPPLLVIPSLLCLRRGAFCGARCAAIPRPLLL